MDVVGSVAALSQLAVYVQCAVKCLRHICETLKTSTSFANSQLEELQVLLEILDRIQRHHSPSDIEDLVPVLISIADTTQVLRNWFEPPETLRHKLNLIAHQSEIEERFRRLREKYNLLVLYYSERNNCALDRIESSLNARHHMAANPTETMGSPQSENGLTLTNTGQSESSMTITKYDETSPPPENTTSARVGSIPGQPTQDFPLAFFSPRSNLPNRGRTKQRPEQEEESQARGTDKGKMRVHVSGNRHYNTEAEICHNCPEHNDTEATYNDNDVSGGSMKVGGMTHPDGKKSVQHKKSEELP